MTETSTTQTTATQDPFRCGDIGDMDFLLSASGSTNQTEEHRAAERQAELDDATDLHAKLQQIFS